jgi:hypothetical protein
MSLLKFFEKTAPNGKRAELFLDSYIGEWLVQARLDGKIQWGGYDVPHRITDEDRRRKNPPPKEAALVVRGLLFREPDATAIEEAWARAKGEAEAKRKAAADALEPVGYLFELGCDRGNTYRVLWPEGTDSNVEDVAEERLGVGLIKALDLDDFRRIAAETSAEAVPVNLGIYWGYRFDRTGFDRLLARAREIQGEKDAARAAKKAARADHDAECLARAKETGKPVIVESWRVACDDPNEECDCDIVERVANPDGSITMHQHHTW